MRQPTAILAEDEPLLRAELREALRALWPELNVVAEAEDGIEAVEALHRHRPDLIFLDIAMPAMSGLEVAALASGRCHVIFLTAYSQHALDAFEQGALDYLVKPLSMPRLATAVARARDRIRQGTPPELDGILRVLAEQAGTPQPYLRWITVAHGRSMQLITCDEVLYFQADNKYTQVVTPTARPLISKTIRELIGGLDPEQFLQIHRGTIVNLNAVAAIDRNLRGALSIRLRQLPEKLPVSATFAHRFRQM
jgi:DNA-binding LytR/AlgR family response regulator